MSRGYVSDLLNGIRIGRTYTEKEVRKAYCNSTLDLNESNFQNFLLKNSAKIIVVETAFERHLTFQGRISSATGIEGADAPRPVRSTETPDSPTAAGGLPKSIESTLLKYKKK